MRIKTPDDLAILARQRRRALGLDQATLARRIGVSRKWIVDFEKGKPSVELSLVLQALKALDLPLSVATEAGDGSAPAIPPIDIDAIIRAARGRE